MVDKGLLRLLTNDSEESVYVRDYG